MESGDGDEETYYTSYDDLTRSENFLENDKDGTFTIKRWNFVNGLVNEFCGSCALTFVITMSSARWPELGSLMYGLAIYWLMQMHPHRLFNPVLNFIFRPLQWNALHEKKGTEDPTFAWFGMRTFAYLGLVLIEMAADVGGAFATMGVIRLITDNQVPTPQGNNTHVNLPFPTPNHKDVDVSLMGNQPILPATAEFVGLLFVFAACYDYAPGHKRSIMVGIATTIASFSLSAYSGGFFNIGINAAIACGIGQWNYDNPTVRKALFVSGLSGVFMVFIALVVLFVQSQVRYPGEKHKMLPAWMRGEIAYSRDGRAIYRETVDRKSVV